MSRGLRSPLIQRHKALARLVLYGLAVLVPTTVWLVSKSLKKPLVLDRSWDLPPEEWAEIEAVRMLQEYLQVDTSAPDGDEIAGAELLARYLEAAGIPTHIERIGERNANLWAILEGDDPAALVLHNHIDVEPPNEEGWRHPPFGGVIDPPWIFGRGAFDMKSVTIAQLMAVLELKRHDVPLARSVMFLATGDEETGSRLGTRRLLHQHGELVARMGVVLTEGGVVETPDLETIKYWGTDVAQKRFVTITARHPLAERLEKLADDIEAIDKAQLERRISPRADRVLDAYGPTRDGVYFADWLADRHANLDDDSFMQLPEYLQLMMRNDVFARTVEADAEGTGFQLEIVLALLPGVTVEEARTELLPPQLTAGVVLEIDEPHPPIAENETEHPVFVAIDRFMASELEQLGTGGRHGPYLIPKQATDARFFRAAGIPAFGYSPFVIVSTETLQMKGVDERMVLPAFVEGVDRYVRLVRALAAKADGPDHD